MKIDRLLESILIFITFNLYNVSAIILSFSLVLVVLFNFIAEVLPLVISYFFWFSLGFFSFSLIIRKAIMFLEKKYKEENKYYIKLLERKGSKNQLRVVFKKDED